MSVHAWCSFWGIDLDSRSQISLHTACVVQDESTPVFTLLPPSTTMTAFRSTVTPLPVPPGWKHTKKEPSPQSQSIKQLINDALEVQDGLNTVKNLLAQLEPDETVTKLVVIALGCQDVRYRFATEATLPYK